MLLREAPPFLPVSMNEPAAIHLTDRVRAAYTEHTAPVTRIYQYHYGYVPFDERKYMNPATLQSSATLQKTPTKMPTTAWCGCRWGYQGWGRGLE